MDFQIPDWLIGALPVINYILNELIIRFGGDLSSEGKQNLVTAVSIAIAAGLALFGAVPVPASPDTTLLTDWVPYVVLLGGWLWGGAKALHDLLEALGFKDSAKPATAPARG